jgi:hypothetical protein
MSDWIKRMADQNRENDQRRKENREWELHRAKTIEANAKSVWDRAVSKIHDGVSRFNEEFPNPELKLTLLKNPSGQITIRRSYFPVVLITISALRASGPIQYFIGITPTSNHRPRIILELYLNPEKFFCAKGVHAC